MPKASRNKLYRQSPHGGEEGTRPPPQGAVLEQLPGETSPSIFKVGGRAKAEAKLSVRETVRNTTRRELVPRFP